MNRENLKKLAEYLPTLDKSFDMWVYAKSVRGNNLGPEDFECATIGCALGHAATLFPDIAEEHKFWDLFCLEVFGIQPNGEEWQWLFSSDWWDVDNTKEGAAKRILWLLEHGVPEDAEAQRDGEAPLCYNG